MCGSPSRDQPMPARRGRVLFPPKDRSEIKDDLFSVHYRTGMFAVKWSVEMMKYDVNNSISVIPDRPSIMKQQVIINPHQNIIIAVTVTVTVTVS